MAAGNVPVTKAAKGAAVKRSRVFRRSRGGCRNCKIRKCDQAKPFCRCCLSFGVECNYGLDVPDLQPTKEAHPVRLGPSRDRAEPRRKTPIPIMRERVTSQVALVKGSVAFDIDARTMRAMDYFYKKIGTRFTFPMTGLLQLARDYPFLMHATLALSHAHERSLHVDMKPVPGRTIAEISHFVQCTTLLGRHLRKTVRAVDCDPIWATASWLSILSFLALDETDPSKAWPFKDSSTSDLDWLRMGDTKWKLFQLTDPTRPDSIFHSITELYAKARASMLSASIHSIPPGLQRLCGLDRTSQPESSPYYFAAQAVANLERLDLSEVSLPEALSFITHAHGPFKVLLLAKDPVALLLFAFWYKAARQAVWWVDLRGATEYNAIGMYLSKYYHNDPTIREFVPVEFTNLRQLPEVISA